MTPLTRRVLPNEASAVRGQLRTLASTLRQNGSIGLGDSGPAVKALQEHLFATGLYTGAISGNFDASTEQALKQFQQAKKLKVTGKVNPSSYLQLSKVNKFVKDGFEKPAFQGERGSDILSAEKRLVKLGFLKRAEADGVYDGDTAKAVSWYRKADKQVPDGLKKIGGLFYRELREASAPRVGGGGDVGDKGDKGGKGGKTTLVVATSNDDFTDDRTDLPKLKADVILAQETKKTNVRKEMMRKGYGVHQNLRNDGQAGAAVAWNKDVVTGGDRGYRLGVEPHGAGMLTRWINYTDVKVDGKEVRMVSVHRPPKRFRFLWPAFDRNLAEFVKNTKGPIVIGMDANERNPQALARKCGLKWHAPEGSIDGFLASPGIKFEKVHRLKKRHSDHRPVVARITF